MFMCDCIASFSIEFSIKLLILCEEKQNLLSEKICFFLPLKLIEGRSCFIFGKKKTNKMTNQEVNKNPSNHFVKII